METLSYSQLRADLAKTMDRVHRDGIPVLITRQNGQAAVLLSQKDFDALEETAYLLRSPRNAQVLFKSIAELESGRGKKKILTL